MPVYCLLNNEVKPGESIYKEEKECQFEDFEDKAHAKLTIEPGKFPKLVIEASDHYTAGYVEGFI